MNHPFGSFARSSALTFIISALLLLPIQPIPPDAAIAAPADGLFTTPLPQSASSLYLIGLGDSLTQGTLDATNNAANTLQAYLQKIADSLGQVTPLAFSQPLFDLEQNRVGPIHVPTNLGVDGSDIFSMEGVEYYRRAGTEESYITESYLCDKWLPRNFEDKYDKVLYPINVLAKSPVTQMDSAIWLLDRIASLDNGSRALVVFWIGANDTSTAALGIGGMNPGYFPIPLGQIDQELSPALRYLMHYAVDQGVLSLEPYTSAAIERTMTTLEDFASQYDRLVTRFETEAGSFASKADLLLLTLPYYGAVGYLFDSEDLEYYLQKVNPAYTVPPTFKRVAPAGEPIVDYMKGDRISIFTFLFMYALLDTGYSVDYVNTILEADGAQHDGLVLSEEELALITARIDGFNSIIKSTAAAHGSNVHLIDLGQYLNDALTGKNLITVDGRTLNRKWSRGSSFSMDGVHPGHTGHALIANFVLERINTLLALDAPLHDLAMIIDGDPYVDNDGDGWAKGPGYPAPEMTELLFLFTDPDDSNADIEPELPEDIWRVISDALLSEMLGVPQLEAEAARSVERGSGINANR